MSLVIEVLRNAHALSHAALLVLLAITAYIEEHDAPAYPSQATLAKDSGVTERYIEACVQECEAAGYLHVERRREPGTRPRNFYTVLYRWRTIPAQASGNLVPRTAFTEPPSVEKQERKKDLQEHAVQGNQFPEPASPNQVQGITDEAAKWLRTAQLSDTFAQVLQGIPPDVPTPAPTPAPPPDPTTPRKPRGEGLYTLGKLCKRGHGHEGTGQSLRRLPSGSCLQCDLERQEVKRQARVQASRAVKPARRIIDLAAHRSRQGG